MTHTPFRLAALTTAALPGFSPALVSMYPYSGDSVDALVGDEAGRRVSIHVALNSLEALRGDAERAVLDALGEEARKALPFALPRVLGLTTTDDVGSLRLSGADGEDGEAFDGQGRAFVHEVLPGEPLQVETLTPAPAGLAASLGRAIAAVHELNPALVRDSGLPDYAPEDYRQRRLADLDQAAATGRVPSRLLERWEHQLENVALWRFQPTICHGELSEDRVRVTGDRVVAVTGWAQLRVADPADDLAWLVAACPEDVVDAVVAAYAQARSGNVDPRLRERAELLSELALVGWLLYGVGARDDSIVDDASGMFAELETHLFPPAPVEAPSPAPMPPPPSSPPTSPAPE